MIKRFKKLSIKAQIISTFIIILLVSFGCLLLLTLNLQQKQIIAMTTIQLQHSTRDVIEKASILRSTVDSRQYENKLDYCLSQQRAEYLSRGYHLSQFIISRSGKVKVFGDMSKIPLGSQEIAQLFKQKQGIIYTKYNQKDYALAYEYNLEDQTAVLLTLPADDYLKPVNSLKNSILLLSLVTMLAAVFIVKRMVNYLTHPIHVLAEAAREVELGLFREHSFPQDMAHELNILAGTFTNMLDTIKNFVTNLTEMVRDLNQTSQELSQSSLEVKSESISLSSRLEDISRQVHEQMSSMNRIRGAVDHLLQSTLIIDHMNQLSVDASQRICEQSYAGRSTMQKVTQQITGVYNSAMDTQTALQKLNQRVDDIAAFNASVEAIAKQIKLLALNATIEAARVGQVGNSFGIVADEVSKLSQETFRFSQETASSIKLMLEDFTALKHSFQTVFNEVESSSNLIIISEEIFQNIYDKTQDNSQSINDVAHECQVISEQIEQLAEEERKIYENSLQVRNAIPAMSESAVQQIQNTEVALQSALYLAGLANQLNEQLSSLDA